MFGGLVGHLASARKNFEKDETKLRQREEKSSELKLKREETLKRESRAAARHRMCEAKVQGPSEARRDPHGHAEDRSVSAACVLESEPRRAATYDTNSDGTVALLGAAVSTPMTRSALAKVGGKRSTRSSRWARALRGREEGVQAAYDQRKKRREDAQRRNDERFARPVVDGRGRG